MYKKTIEYQTYDDVPETLVEDFYFDINETEATEIQFEAVGGWEQMINKIFIERDGKKLFSLFKDLVLKAYGERTPDGRGFIKSQELRDKFEHSDAYNKLMMELFNSEGAIQEFFLNVFPVDKEHADDLLAEVEKRNPNLANKIHQQENKELYSVVKSETEGDEDN